MNLNQLADASLNNIKQNGIQGNPYIDFVKKSLNQGIDFYKYANAESLGLFSTLVSQGDIKVSDKEDVKPILTQSYWDRGKKSQSEFVYTAKILPQLRKKYPRAYSIVFNQGSGKIIEAGLSTQQRNNPDLLTIWNVVEKFDAGSGSSGGSDSSSKTKDVLKVVSNADARRAIIQKSLGDVLGDNSKKVDEKVAAVSKFIASLLKEL